MIKYAFLGIVQGLTEFFPVSSSGHLVIVQHVLGISEHSVALDIVLHVGTLAAVCVFFRREIARFFSDRRLLGLIAITTVITGVIGVAGHKFFSELFSRPQLLAAQFLLNGIVLLLAGRRPAGTRETLGAGDAIVVGGAQALAIIPAISRSGMTIAALLFRNVDRGLCFSFSFIVSIPAIIGAAALDYKDIGAVANADFAGLAAGFLFSLLSGVAALAVLKKLLVSDKFRYFGYYCVLLGVVLLLTVR